MSINMGLTKQRILHAETEYYTAIEKNEADLYLKYG